MTAAIATPVYMQCHGCSLRADMCRMYTPCTVQGACLSKIVHGERAVESSHDDCVTQYDANELRILTASNQTYTNSRAMAPRMTTV